MRLVAKKPGRVKISVRARITASMADRDQYQFEKDRELRHSIEVEVFDDLSLRSPLLPRNTLLMSPGSEYQLRTNRETEGEITYKVLAGNGEAEGVSVSPSGLVSAGRHAGSAVVLVEDREDYGVTQRMSVIVDVKPVSYMMINVRKAFAPASDRPAGKLMSRLPQGFDLPMDVTFHDNTGLQFDVTSDDLETRPSRFDTLLVKESGGQNRSFSTELVRNGYTVLKVSADDSSASLKDFIIMNTGRGIEPEVGSPVVGDVLELANVVSDSSFAYGYWKAEPAGSVDLDERSGLAVLLRSGPARLSYFVNEFQRTSVDMDAAPAASLAFRHELAADLVVARQSNRPVLVEFGVKSSKGNESTNYHGFRVLGAPVKQTARLEYVYSKQFVCSAQFVDGKK